MVIMEVKNTENLENKDPEKEPKREPMALDFATVNRSAAARALRVNVAHVSRILSGQRVPSFKLAWKIAWYFNISLEELHKRLYPDAKAPRPAKKDNYYREN